MWGLRQFATLPESYHDASQFASLPRMLAYASGLTSDFPTMNAYAHCTYARSEPSLKMRLLCLASVFGFVGTAIFEPTTADSYLQKESTIAKAGLLANIGPDGIKSSGAKVRRTTLAYFIHSSTSSLALWSPVQIPTILTTCTPGSATRHLYLKLSRINSPAEMMIRCAAGLTALLLLRVLCNRCPTPVGQSKAAASESQSLRLVVVRTLIRGVALSEVRPC